MSWQRASSLRRNLADGARVVRDAVAAVAVAGMVMAPVILLVYVNFDIYFRKPPKYGIEAFGSPEEQKLLVEIFQRLDHNKRKG